MSYHTYSYYSATYTVLRSRYYGTSTYVVLRTSNAKVTRTVYRTRTIRSLRTVRTTSFAGSYVGNHGSDLRNDLTFLVGRNTPFHLLDTYCSNFSSSIRGYYPLQKDNIMTPKTVAIQVSVTILAPAIIVAMLVIESASVTQRAFRRPKIHPVVLPTARRTVE